MKNIEKLNEEYERLHEALKNDDPEATQGVFDLEQEVEQAMDFSLEESQQQLQGLLKRIKALKREFDFYDEEAELDRMFPDRHDDDFDEDSMSYESVFGDE
jgi:DNA repair ATPase RecN